MICHCQLDADGNFVGGDSHALDDPTAAARSLSELRSLTGAEIACVDAVLDATMDEDRVDLCYLDRIHQHHFAELLELEVAS